MHQIRKKQITTSLRWKAKAMGDDELLSRKLRLIKQIFLRATKVFYSTTNLKKSMTNNVCLLCVVFGVLEPFDRCNYQGEI